MKDYLIVPISAERANKAEMTQAVRAQTGGDEPFWCPEVVEGEPYDGHAHVFLPKGVTEASATPIELRANKGI